MNKIARLAALSIAAAAAPMGAYAEASIWDGLRNAGSETLIAWALSEPELPLEALAERNKILEDMGFLGEQFAVTQKWANFSPVLSYDSDLNGGYPGTSVVVSGLTFEIDKQYERKSGLLAGMSGAAGFTMPVDDGLAWESHIFAMFGYAPEHDLSKLRIAGESCLKKMLSTSTYLNGCLDMSYSHYDLGESFSAGARLGVSHAFAAYGALHEVQADLLHNKYGAGSDYDQQVASVRVTTAHAGGFATMAGLQIGSKVEGELVMRERIEFGVIADLWDAPVSIMVSAQSNRGGLWLGEDREEQVYSLSLSRQFGDRLGGSLSVSDTRSSADFFDDTAVGLNVSYDF